jgi:hypothetical protein
MATATAAARTPPSNTFFICICFHSCHPYGCLSACCRQARCPSTSVTASRWQWVPSHCVPRQVLAWQCRSSGSSLTVDLLEVEVDPRVVGELQRALHPVGLAAHYDVGRGESHHHKVALQFRGVPRFALRLSFSRATAPCRDSAWCTGGCRCRGRGLDEFLTAPPGNPPTAGAAPTGRACSG